MSNENENKFEDTKAKIITYFKGIKSEWGKITWPQRPQVVTETIVVLVIVFLFTAFVFFVDILFKMLFEALKLS